MQSTMQATLARIMSINGNGVDGVRWSTIHIIAIVVVPLVMAAAGYGALYAQVDAIIQRMSNDEQTQNALQRSVNELTISIARLTDTVAELTATAANSQSSRDGSHYSNPAR